MRSIVLSFFVQRTSYDLQGNFLEISLEKMSTRS